MAVQSYSDVLRGKMPAFLLGPWGEKWVGVFGAVFDYLRDRAREGIKARFPTECDATLLQTHGWERSIDRIAGEEDDAYRTRIHQARTTWKNSGTDLGVLKGLEALGWNVSPWITDFSDWPTEWETPANVWLVPARLWGARTPDGDEPTPHWARFWVVIDWCSRVGTADIREADKAAIVGVIKKWKASKSPLRGVICIQSAGGWDDVRGGHTTRGPDRTRGGRTEVLT